MRVPLRATVLGVSLLALSPIPADAAAILTGATGTSCASLSSNCTVFDIDPSAGAILSGEFVFDNDVALFQFVLTLQTTFSAVTSSYATDGTGGFDPTLGLFFENGTIVQYPDPADSTAFYAARGLDVDPDTGDYNDILPTLLLEPGTYYLALLQYPNSFHVGADGLDSLLAGFELDDTPFVDGGCSGAQSQGACGFSLSITASAVDTTAVPEPGTLSLLALGSGAMALVRRRRTREAAHRP
jgi:hypothetical protein